MNKIIQNPDGSYQWECPIDRDFHRQSVRKGLWSVPIFCAVMILVFLFASRGSDRQSNLWIPLLVIAVVLLIALPLFYLMLLSDGFDSLEGLLIGLALSLGEALIAYGLTVLLFFAMRFIQGYKREGDRSCDLLPSDWLDFSNRTSLACALVSFAAFLYFFISEIVDTVIYIIKYSGYYRTGEIVYIIFSFVYDILLLFVYYLTFILIKRLLSKRIEK